MTAHLSWEGSFGSQLLAEISLLEAEAKATENASHHKSIGRRTSNKVSVTETEVQIPATAMPDGPIHSSWESSFGSQLMKEISLLEAQNKVAHRKSLSIIKTINEVSVEDLHRPIAEAMEEAEERQAEAEIQPSNRKTTTSSPQYGCSSPSMFSQNSFEGETQNSRLDATRNVETNTNSPLSSSTPVSSNTRKGNLHSSHLMKLQLKSWGLPSAVVKKYAEKKIETLFPWQVECLMTGKVLSKGNLIYSAPTSSGKTLVSEILMLKTVFDDKKKGNLNTETLITRRNILIRFNRFSGLYILPFVAVAKEKTRLLKSVTEDAGIRVESFAGSTNPPGGLKSCDLAVCTIEKANSLINRMIEEGTLSQIGVVVVDELHLIADAHRGYLLELLLTKLLYICQRNGQSAIQIIGMSATLPDLEILAKWLRADLYRTTFRPIVLQEHVKIGQDVWTPDMRTLIRKIQPEVMLSNDSDHVIYLSLETVIAGFSVVIFCPTKNWCEKMAQSVAAEFFTLGSAAASEDGMKLRAELNGQQLADTIHRLKNSPAGLDPVLAHTIRFGVAFHHAGLTSEERDIIESAFRLNILRVLVATSTLSSGVNLPARRVIIRTPIFHGTVIDPLVYRQMIGRAGRYGQDTSGESYLICQPSDVNQVKRMFGADPKPLKSCLLAADSVSSSMKRAMLEVIATGSATSTSDLTLYAACTLLATLNDVPQSMLTACVDWLVEFEFIRRIVADDGERLGPTQLGLACLASSLTPDDSLVLLAELQTARKGVILDSDLHLIYQVIAVIECHPFDIRSVKQCSLFCWVFFADNSNLRFGSTESNRLASLSEVVGRLG